MTRCTEYEIELSALIDGESDPATVIELMDHLSQCAACREFYGELRSFQSKVDGISLAGTIEEAPAPQVARAPAPRALRRRWFEFGAPPRWAWGALAGAVVAVALWVGGVFENANGPTPNPYGGEIVLTLEEDKNSVDEQRFVELVAEVLRADRRYQRQMLVVLNEMNRGSVPGESPFVDDRMEGSSAESPDELLVANGERRVLN